LFSFFFGSPHSPEAGASFEGCAPAAKKKITYYFIILFLICQGLPRKKVSARGAEAVRRGILPAKRHGEEGLGNKFHLFFLN
jgi:hypothetical protein